MAANGTWVHSSRGSAQPIIEFITAWSMAWIVEQPG